MAIELVRIDDRLIHGQVVTAWITDYHIEQILIINDAVRNDEMQQNIIAMTSPANILVKIFGVREFAEIAAKNPIKRRTLLILTCPKDVLTLVEAGLSIPYLNIGGMRFGGERRALSKAVFVTNEDIVCLKKLLELGVQTEIRLLPKTEGVWVKDILQTE